MIRRRQASARRTRTAIASVASSFVLAACTGEHGGPSPRPTVAASTSTARAPVGSAPAPSDSTPRPPQRPVPLPDGCYNGVAVDELGPAEAVESIAARCAQGMTAVLPGVRTLHVDGHTPASVDFEVDDSSRCYRIVAVAPRAPEVVLELSDGKRIVANENLTAPLALLGQRGPICLEARGRYSVVLRVPDSDTVAALQVYRAD